MQSNASINLLKGRVNWLDEVTKWGLSVGRLLIIIIEFVAFGAFIYRFTLDRTLIDLHDKIKQEQAIVAHLSDTEKTYRNLQERLKVASEVDQSGGSYIKIVKDVVAFTPPEIKFTSFVLSGNSLVIQANVKSTSSLSTFLSSLREYPLVSSVTLTSLQNTADQGTLQVGISVVLKNISQGI